MDCFCLLNIWNDGMICEKLIILIKICSDIFDIDGLINVILQHDEEEDKEVGVKMIDKGDDILIVWLQKDINWARKINQ